MSRKIYYVSSRPNGWAVKARGAERASAVTETKVEAVTRAKELAQNHSQGQVVVKGEDGRIQTEYTYGDDPFPPKG